VSSSAWGRALGALYGLAIGDALGMPTQSFPRAEVVRRHGSVLSGFEPGPPDQPLAPGLAAGSVTDDTEQALILAESLIDGGGRIDPAAFARRLVAWEDSMRRRGSSDLLGPSTRRAVTELLAGAPPDQSGRLGATNGAAMRVTPVGVAVRPGPGLIDAVVAASEVTHNTSVALAGAAAVAAAVSAGVDGAGVDGVVAAARAARDAARAAVVRGHWLAAADVSARIDWLGGLLAPSWNNRRAESAAPAIRRAATSPNQPHVIEPSGASAAGMIDTTGPSLGGPPGTGLSGRAGLTQPDVIGLVCELVGTSLATQESVPAAFACALAHGDDPWLAVRVAASLGGDCDTIAAMTGAILGACHGFEAFPAAARETVAEVNGLTLEPVARALLALRERGAP
jgi:ADP-ribosylglycohydrolase